MKRNKVGYGVALQMIHEGKVDYRKTEGGRYKIKVGGNMVSRELYEKTLERAIRAETMLENIKAVLV